jgi:DNA-binding GntR family transcriptional regulator
VSEADQRAAGNLGARMPKLPITVDAAGSVVVEQPAGDNPYQRIAADLRSAITCGALKPGDLIPTVTELSARYGVSAGTAHRAIAELKSAGLITASRGRRAVVTSPTTNDANVVPLHTKHTG